VTLWQNRNVHIMASCHVLVKKVAPSVCASLFFLRKNYLSESDTTWYEYWYVLC